MDRNLSMLIVLLAVMRVCDRNDAVVIDPAAETTAFTRRIHLGARVVKAIRSSNGAVVIVIRKEPLRAEIP